MININCLGLEMFKFTVRRMFGFMPERSTRYFTLSVQLKDDLPLSGILRNR